MKQYLLLCAIVLTSCSQKKDQAGNALSSDRVSSLSDSSIANSNPETDAWKLDTYLTQESPDTASIQRITSDCAVFIYPTDDQIDELTRENGEEDFSTIADDSNYYQSIAMDLLDSARITTVTASRHYIKFTGENNTWLLDIRKKGAVTWGIILFTKTKQPEIVSAIDLTEERINQYFHKNP